MQTRWATLASAPPPSPPSGAGPAPAPEDVHPRRRPRPKAVPAGSLRPPRCHGAAAPAAAAALHAAAGPWTPALRVLLRGGGKWGRGTWRFQPLVSSGACGAVRGARSCAGRLTARLSRSVTDAAELWSTCFTPDSLAALVGNGASGRPVAPSTPHGSAARLWDRRVWDPPPPEGSERPSHSSVALVPKSVPRGSGSGRFGVSPVVLGSQAPGDQSLCPVESPFWPECG